MKKTTLGLGSIVLAAAFSLTACGTNEGELAKEYCGLLEDVNAATESGDADKIQKASEAVNDWIKKNEDVEGDEDEFTDAVNDECGDIAKLP